MKIYDIIRMIIKCVSKEYLIFYIYGHSTEEEIGLCNENGSVLMRRITDVSDLKRSSDTYICRSGINSEGHESYCFGSWKKGEVATVCWYWDVDTYRMHRNFWPLQDGEAKLVNLFTTDKFRGQGMAAMLIGFSSKQMYDLGYKRLYARIWHSNKPSIRAFKRAGWHRIALVLEVKFHFKKKPMRIVFHNKRDNNFYKNRFNS